VSQDQEIIIGAHSIREAIKNPLRANKELMCTEDSLKNFPEYKKEPWIKLLSTNEFQARTQKLYQMSGFEYFRIPGTALLLCDELPILETEEFFKSAPHIKGLKVMCLDQVTDVQNAAAILRTAAFYGVHYLVVEKKNSFRLTPSFYRIASGATEHVPMVRISTLTKFVTKLKEHDIKTIGFSEHAKGDAKADPTEKKCLIFGSEDLGISHAVLRLLDNVVSLEAKGNIKSLNVSNAVAIAMDRFF
jgi:23S rRNA (guanosine2251-2'-O)-methyltransferase